MAFDIFAVYDSFFTSLFICKKNFIIIGDLNLKKLLEKWFELGLKKNT